MFKESNYFVSTYCNLISIFLLLIICQYNYSYCAAVKDSCEIPKTYLCQKREYNQIKEQDKKALAIITKELESSIANLAELTGWENRNDQKNKLLKYIIKEKISLKGNKSKSHLYETVYWGPYRLLLPINQLSITSLSAFQIDSNKIIAIIRFHNDWKMHFCLNSFGHYDYNEYSEAAYTTFEDICNIASLSDETKFAIKEKLKGRMLFPNDYELLRHVWSKDYSNIETSDLNIVELFEVYYSTLIKLTIWPGSTTSLRFPGAEIETEQFRGLMFGDVQQGFELFLFDELNYITITCTNDEERRTGKIDYDVLNLSLSSMILHQSQTPALDMLRKAEQYLITLPHVSMVFIRAAQQYPADEQTAENIIACENQAKDKLIANLTNENPQVKISTVWWLGNLNVRKAQAPLVKATDDEDPNVRYWALKVLSNPDIGTNKEILLNILKDKFENDENSLVKAASIYALGSQFHDFGLDNIYLNKIIDAASDHNPVIRINALEALIMIKPDPNLVKPVFYKALNDEDAEVRNQAQLALEIIGLCAVLLQ